jgi:hypothetical protein
MGKSNGDFMGVNCRDESVVSVDLRAPLSNDVLA